MMVPDTKIDGEERRIFMHSIPADTAARHRHVICFVASLFLLLIAPGGLAAQPFSAETDPVAEIVGVEAFLEALEGDSQPIQRKLGRVFKVNRFFSYEPGKRLYVTEYFTLETLRRRPARAAIFLTGPEFRGSFWDIPVDGYSAPVMAAKRGFYAYTLDYVGVGRSHLPENGSQINYLTNVTPVRRFVDRVRLTRGVALVDLVGEHYGGEIAAAVAQEIPDSIRSVVMSTMNYEAISEEVIDNFLTPELEAFLRSDPDGYWEPELLPFTLFFSDNEQLREYVFATQTGTYPTGSFLQFFDLGLPVLEPAAQQVPLLLFAGELDGFLVPGDMENLAAEWGGGATLVVIPGAHKAPRIETAEIAGMYFQEVFDFLDP